MSEVNISINTRNEIEGKVSTKQKINANIYPRGPRGPQGVQGPKGDTGNGIASIEKTSTVGLVDTYTITFTNGTTFDFTVTNANAGNTYTKTEIEQFLAQKVNITDIIDTLNSNDTEKPLSAKQGKVLKDLIDNTYTSSEIDAFLSTLNNNITTINNNITNINNNVSSLDNTKLNKTVVTDAYSSTSTYAVGDYCIKDNTLYKCTTAISTAEEFNSNKWTAVNISDELKSKSNKKQVIWDGNVQVKTEIGNSLSLIDMPNLSAYIGKVINFYFSYSGDALVKHSVLLNEGSNGFYYTHTRNNSGNDLWLIELSFGNLKSRFWTVATVISSIINSDNGMRIDNENHNLRLYRVEVEP